MATATNYVINPLELPADQTAAALFNQTVIVDTSGATWAASPMGSGTGGGSSSFGDVPTATRTTAAQAALAREQARLQNDQDAHNRNISIITATP